MNWDLARAFWLHRLRSRGRLILMLTIVGFGVGRLVLFPEAGLSVSDDGYFFTCLIGFGMISQDVSSGAAQMILVRPVRRLEYILSRYVATCLAALAVGLFELLLAVAIVTSRGGHPDASLLLVAGLELTAKVVTTASVIALLSCVATGLGDIAIYAMLLVLGGFSNFLATMGRQAWAGWISKGLAWLVSTGISARQFDAGGDVLGKATLQLGLTVAGCLAVGYAVFRRRELSYSD